MDTESIEAWLIPSGGALVQMLQVNQVYSPGLSGRIIPGIDSDQYFGDAVYIVPDSPLDPNRTYTVRVVAETLDNVSIHLDRDEWDFTAAACLFPGAGEPPVLDPGPVPPAEDGRYLLLGRRNACGSGSDGPGSGGPRSISACP